MHQTIPLIARDMFHLPLPWMEKILRPVIVYIFLIGFLRIFGKRELAQLNPFDLVVLLSLSNTVQNAIIGDDNSVTGGILGAFSLLAINWMLVGLLYRTPRLTNALEGHPSTLIANGKVDVAELRRQKLTEADLISVLNRNGVNEISSVEICSLQPNGTFLVKSRSPSGEQIERGELMAVLAELTAEVRSLRSQVNASTRET